MRNQRTSLAHAKSAQIRTGATGLEPATSGVTGDARANTFLHGKAQKSPVSRDFVWFEERGFHAPSWGFRRVPPHPDPIALSPLQAMSSLGTTRQAFMTTVCAEGP